MLCRSRILICLGLGVILSACAQGGGVENDAGVLSPPEDAQLMGDDADTPSMDAGIPLMDSAVGPTDTGVPVVDTGVPVVDTGVPVVDSGTGPMDSGVVVTDSGVPVVDSGTGPMDSGVVVMDSGVPLMDSGVGPVDSGVIDSGVADSGVADSGVADSGVGCGVDCAVCPGGFCAAGVCVPSPTSIDYDFESGLPTAWTSTGDASWTVTTTSPHGGLNALASGVISNSQSSGITTTVNFPNTTLLSFWVRTDTESRWDELTLYVDGSAQGAWSGETAWTEGRTLLTAGAHTLEWRYEKDSSVSLRADQVWLDDVRFQRATSSITTLDFEGSTTLPAGITSSGDASWTVTSAVANGGTNSAQSGAISDSQTTSLQYTVTVSATTDVSFYYRTSTESTYDRLGFYVDGLIVTEWSGTNAWANYTYALTSGTHALEWRYTKDVSLSSGSDQVWIDDISVNSVTAGTGAVCTP